MNVETAELPRQDYRTFVLPLKFVAMLEQRSLFSVTKRIGMSPFKILRCAAVLCTLTTLVACGAGSGGGGSEGDSSYGVRVLHAAIDGAPVDITSSAATSPVLTQQVFAGTKGYRSLPEAPQSLNLIRSQATSDVIGSFAVTVASTDRYSLLLYGDTVTFGLKTRLIKDEIPTTSDGSAFIRVVNAVAQAAEASIVVGSSPREVVSFGGNTLYIPTAPGAVNVSAVRTVDGAVIRAGAIEVKPGRAYTLLLAGELGYYVKSVVFEDS